MKLKATPVGWLYTSPPIPEDPTYVPLAVLSDRPDEAEPGKPLERWIRRPVYTLSPDPQIEIEVEVQR